MMQAETCRAVAPSAKADPLYFPRMSAATLVLHAGFVVAGMATTLLGPILPALTTRWGMSDVVAGSLFTAQFLSSMTATLIAPGLAARIGARGAIALGFSLLAMGTFTIGLASHAIGVGATVIYGLGLGFVLPLTNIAIAALRPDRAASALSLVNVSWGVGAVIWPMIVRSFGTVDSVAVPMAALGISCALMAIVCALAIPATLLSAARRV
jgi:MFS transporter, FHS family, glucose/mannose:H+ symporter